MTQLESSPASRCTICDCTLTSEFWANEKMFGLGGEFVFATCPTCGVIIQTDPPEDMSSFYPASKYYSLQSVEPPKRPLAVIRAWLARQRTEAQLFGKPVWALPLAWMWKSKFAEAFSMYASHSASHIDPYLRILDVGCGQGLFLNQLSEMGFRKLEGVDPFIETAEIKRGAIRIRRENHIDLGNEEYDLIILNHSLEHMEDQQAALKAIARLLAPDGTVKLEVPVADCDAFEIYGSNWIELDAPRHLCLHTRRSLHELARQVSLKIESITEAGSAFEFWGSEMYKRGMTFATPSGDLRSPEECFTQLELDQFDQQARLAVARQRSGRVLVKLKHLS